MGTTGIVSSSTESYKKAFHTRNDSGELDVFEAANYFSGYNEINSSQYNKSMMRDDCHQRSGRVSRISLDVPLMRRNSSLLLPTQQYNNNNSNNNNSNNNNNKEKKFKQPSSPGGRFANFLNSLFHQASSKKKSKSMVNHDQEENNQVSGWRRKRRSSISHFQSSTTTIIDDDLSSHSKSGFRTPPVCNINNNAAAPVAFTPTKNYKEFRSISDHTTKKSSNDKKININNNNNNKLKFDNARIMNNSLKEDDHDHDDGVESDSSSDLFELPNYDLGIYNSSSGLPVYETTRMESIKRGAPISTI
ncbi:hypothetical protein ACFE04_027222 [Oxalis oulophora]